MVHDEVVEGNFFKVIIFIIKLFGVFFKKKIIGFVFNLQTFGKVNEHTVLLVILDSQTIRKRKLSH